MTNVKTIADVAAIVDPRPLFIADGHHRYETACNYRDWLAERGALDANHPAEFRAYAVRQHERSGAARAADASSFSRPEAHQLRSVAVAAGARFQTRTIARGADHVPSLWEDLEVVNEQGRLAFYTADDDTWTHADITPEGARRMAELAGDHSGDWQSLGVSILHRLVMENLLRHKELPKPMYVHSAEEVAAAVRKVIRSAATPRVKWAAAAALSSPAS